MAAMAAATSAALAVLLVSGSGPIVRLLQDQQHVCKFSSSEYRAGEVQLA
jgi:hypothetical protein